MPTLYPLLRRKFPVACLATLALAAPAGASQDAEAEHCRERTAALSPPDFVGIAAREAAAVVRLVAIGAAREWETGPPDEGTAVAHGPARPPRPMATAQAWPERTAASGFLFATDGRILTNAHAVADAREVWAVLDDGRRLRARVLGWDRPSDVALLQVDAARLPTVRIDPAARPCAGEWVAAIGAPFGFARSVTAGVVSAHPRYLPGLAVPLIQSDVALNPGSSGGPLFDARGQVIGMNSMVYSATGGYLGVSFSVPIANALAVAEQLLAQGRVRRSQIGLRMQPITPELAQAFGAPEVRGVLVVRVEDGGPAAAAGLRSGDLLLALDGSPAASAADLQQRIAAAQPGQRLVFDVWRGGAAMAIAVQAASSPGEEPRETEPPDAAQPRFGLALADRPERAGGAFPAGLYVMAAGGGARSAGIQPGDRVLAVNETPVGNLAQFDAALARRPAGAAAALLIQRGTALSFVPVGASGPGLLPDELP